MTHPDAPRPPMTTQADTQAKPLSDEDAEAVADAQYHAEKNPSAWWSETFFELIGIIERVVERAESAERALSDLRKEMEWRPIESGLPPPHTNVWCLNRNGIQFEGRVCYGMHKPFFTYPRGDGSPSNTAPSWIDVTHWRPLPPPPSSGSPDNG